MGVGEYSEDDVREAARAFTGWNYRGLAFHVEFGKDDHVAQVEVAHLQPLRQLEDDVELLDVAAHQRDVEAELGMDRPGSTLGLVESLDAAQEVLEAGSLSNGLVRLPAAAIDRDLDPVHAGGHDRLGRPVGDQGGVGDELDLRHAGLCDDLQELREPLPHQGFGSHGQEHVPGPRQDLALQTLQFHGRVVLDGLDLLQREVAHDATQVALVRSVHENGQPTLPHSVVGREVTGERIDRGLSQEPLEQTLHRAPPSHPFQVDRAQRLSRSGELQTSTSWNDRRSGSDAERRSLRKLEPSPQGSLILRLKQRHARDRAFDHSDCDSISKNVKVR